MLSRRSILSTTRFRFFSSIPSVTNVLNKCRLVPNNGNYCNLASTSIVRSYQRNLPSSSYRYMSSNDQQEQDDSHTILHTERETMSFDVLIVGGGPAGLAASIRLKQQCHQQNTDLSVCVVEKGSEIGSHILSGNVFDSRALNELIPDLDWTTELLEMQSSYATPVESDQFLVLTETSSYKIPHVFFPSELHNTGNYIISLGQLCRYLGTKAEELGVEIYPGFAANEVLYNDDKTAVRGIATKDMGIDKHGKPKGTFQRGVELLARQTLFAEGARGSCSEALISHFNLRKNKALQLYGLGIKEVWEVPEENFHKGFVQHTLGYPLQNSLLDDAIGGTFLYHQEPNLILAGLVIGLNYSNPYLNPYKEFQRWKTHPDICGHFKGGTCISYGARVLNEGGYHSIPKLTFPGGALIGCSAGFLNTVKIKGSHTAMKSGILAADAVLDILIPTKDTPTVAEFGEIDQNEVIQEITNYSKTIGASWVMDELYHVRNCPAAFARWGAFRGTLYTGFSAHVSKGWEPWTLSHGDICDSDRTKEKIDVTPINYPLPDGILTFDLLTNLQRSGTFHEEDQETHLRIKPECSHIPKTVSMQIYGAPEQRFCPAGVYEYTSDDDDEMRAQLVINAQNCIHCKCCSIKMPGEYIQWTVPEGGGGPQYQVM